MASTGFCLERFIGDTRVAAGDTRPVSAVLELMRAVFSAPRVIDEAVPDYADNDVLLFEDETVSIWFMRVPAGTCVPPHDHRIPAVIGVYRGAEVNRFYRCTEAGLVEINERCVGAGDVVSIGPDGIHTVQAEPAGESCGLHVYLGPLSQTERSLYEPGSGRRLAFSMQDYEHLKQAL